ncbi:MAG: MoxR family ATPase [Chloroflexi bacterium]|nr:MoxR family ATPase [Chloroflexota bacterium]
MSHSPTIWHWNLLFNTIEAVQQALLDQRYIADRGLATVIFLALKLGKPLFLEGEAGVGKTEVAKALASVLGARLIRLQCYEGLDVHNAVYEWAYARQILHLRVLEASGASRSEMERDLYGREFLLARPLLQAIEEDAAGPPVLLIDEIDRADEEFESFLLELLSDFQITIPEIGTIRATRPPVVIVTSNRTREVHDALKRRCLYHWINYPDFETEYQIVTLKTPGIAAQLSYQVTRVVQALRQADLFKAPGVAETLDWANALLAMDCADLDEATINDTLGVLLKYQDDVQRVQGALARDLAKRARAT